MSNAKNVVLMAAALCLTVGFIAYTHLESTDENLSANNPAESESITEVANNDQSIISVENGIPEMSCSSIRLSDGSLIFANSKGSYTLINSEHQTISSSKVQDDDGNTITISCQKGDICFFNGSDKIELFSYGGHTVELKNGILYYDKSKVIYEDTAFSLYKLSDDCTLKCIEKNKFKLTDKRGSEIKSLTLIDDNGNSITFYTKEKGIEVVNSEDYLESTIRINGSLIIISDENVIVNGVTMVPPGYNDIHTVTQKSTTTSKIEAETKPVVTTVPKETTTVSQTQTSSQTTQVTTKQTTTQKKQQEIPQDNQNISEETKEMLNYVNEFREQYGLSKLTGSSVLESAAQLRVEELAKSYDHTRPDGKSFDTVLDEKNLTWWHSAENIANGTNTMTTVKEAFEAWINSSGHRANILSPKMKYMAVAKKTIEKDGNTITYWEQIFFNDEYMP